jgi:hypothetical protein
MRPLFVSAAAAGAILVFEKTAYNRSATVISQLPGDAGVIYSQPAGDGLHRGCGRRVPGVRGAGSYVTGWGVF